MVSLVASKFGGINFDNINREKNDNNIASYVLDMKAAHQMVAIQYDKSRNSAMNNNFNKDV
jgi:hypothetical protein